MNVVIKAKSSSGEPYDVTFTGQNNLLTVFCTCPAGEWGKMCKHKRAFLKGDTSFLYNSTEASDLELVVDLVKKTDWPVLEKEHDQIKTEIEILERKEKSSRAKIERLLNEGIRIS